MSKAGARHLRDVREVGGTHVRVACAQCAREGRYGVPGLLQAHGDIALPDLLALLTGGCSKRQAGKPFDKCVATFDLQDESRSADIPR